MAASDFVPRYRFVTVIRWFGEELKIHCHNVTCVTDQLPRILRLGKTRNSKKCLHRKREGAEEVGIVCELRGASRKKPTEADMLIYITTRYRRRCRSRDSLSLRLSEFIHEFSLSQAVINAATTAGAETLPSLASPPFRLLDSLISTLTLFGAFSSKKGSHTNSTFGCSAIFGDQLATKVCALTRSN